MHEINSLLSNSLSRRYKPCQTFKTHGRTYPFLSTPGPPWTVLKFHGSLLIMLSKQDHILLIFNEFVDQIKFLFAV
jgi:hypothetical protein